MSEKKTKQWLKGQLDKHKIMHVMPAGTIYGKAGVADFLCCVNGTFVAIEAKSFNGKQTPLQLLFEKTVIKNKGYYFLINETNKTEVLKKILEIKELKSETV